jgi:hypothetical protein
MSDDLSIAWIVVSGLVMWFAILSPLWIGLAFILFAIYRRRFGVAFLLTWIAAEALGLVVSRVVFEFLEAMDK